MLTAQNNSFTLVSVHLIVAELAVSTFPWNLNRNGFETNWCADTTFTADYRGE
jgi:hypothetical protein